MKTVKKLVEKKMKLDMKTQLLSFTTRNLKRGGVYQGEGDGWIDKQSERERQTDK